MSGSITNFSSNIHQVPIKDLFSNYPDNQSEEQEQKIIEQLTSQPIYVNQQFVKDWIVFTKDLLRKQQEAQQAETNLQNLQILYLQAKGELKRKEMFGSATTAELLMSQNFKEKLITDKLKSIQEQLQKKKDDVPNLIYVDIFAAKIESQDILIQAKELLEQLEQYNTDLLNRSQDQELSFQLLSTGSQNFSDEQTWRMNQQQQQNQRENTNPDLGSQNDYTIQS
ncbi:unnamed protein product (macronuclear) [Paramecium tetraurelia]|uniref:Chromosome undetermined scaffold_10, whole genome shotgun sequence n=1 Tax=Paramecium tetraurelia TaxID=5888 RepID=A0BD18_PARTE|nr:uncharacterized protein GSPATT00004529001 [Paramecium tetraurelia]XP_001440960.1 uncharacterized protein GSPATT00038913001 [Paramecium tetraurelia]CAK56435.1 unnamed protein product [Paramecium tetraurelia]CAK73563.1 unnamed protein product [Paramecium tetraurelia]|eukprot:XP_001423833.1 hypothetical protein (macronuclear) [Paramecium tetraurelia strain d4-2]